MKLINPNEIPFLLVQVGPVLTGEPVHYERVAFRHSIDRMQRIEAEPVKHAHWIEEKHKIFGREIFTCSNCGNFLDFSGVNAGRGDANYCPNCGADMRGEQDG